MYLVIGGNGFFGSYMIQSILEHTNENIIATARSTAGLSDSERVRWEACDITNRMEFDRLTDRICGTDQTEGAAKVEQTDPVKVFFLAAYHNPDLVAENPRYAWHVNVTSLSECVNRLSFAKKLFYASTDSVYGNSEDHYHFKETDSLNPVNLYGRNKAAAEAVVKYAGFQVIRYPFLMSPSLVKGKAHFYDRIAGDLKENRQISMFCDSYRSSLDFKTAADLSVRLSLLEEPLPSVINVCGDKDLSKYDIGLMLANKLGVSRQLVKPVKMSENDTVFKTKRAVSTLMDNALVKSVLGIKQIEFLI